MPYAINEEHLRNAAPSLTANAFVWFHRMIATVCVYYGVSYWAQLIGLSGGISGRFDLLPVHWQVASSSLAVLYPVAATGLWMVVSWGAVIWAAAAIAEFVMYFVYPQLFGPNDLILLAHAATAFLYIAFRLALYRETRAQS